MLDGHDLRDVTLESVRAQVGTVLQADLIFTDSVLVNIGMGDPFNALPRVIEAAKLAHAHQFIQDLPHGYDTIIGPLGHYLRPDEQFRIALARAYLHDPSIVIVEEPSVAIDEDIRLLLDDTLARLAQGRTSSCCPIVSPRSDPATRSFCCTTPGSRMSVRRPSFRRKASSTDTFCTWSSTSSAVVSSSPCSLTTWSPDPTAPGVLDAQPLRAEDDPIASRNHRPSA